MEPEKQTKTIANSQSGSIPKPDPCASPGNIHPVHDLLHDLDYLILRFYRIRGVTADQNLKAQVADTVDALAEACLHWLKGA